jgi:hypothetical protein
MDVVASDVRQVGDWFTRKAGKGAAASSFLSSSAAFCFTRLLPADASLSHLIGIPSDTHSLTKHIAGSARSPFRPFRVADNENS